jgi:putative nucleotidyltransferase with HDIG domain
MASLAGEDVSFAVLGDLIEKDAVLTGNILRVVNSAAYARSTPVSSVRRALSILGIEKVRNTVLAMSISRMLNQAKPPAGFNMEEFNRHSAAVAMLSDLLAQRVDAGYPEGAFVAGLLHDVGRLLIPMALPHEYYEILRRREQTGLPWVQCEMDVVGFTHASLSADVLDQWKLPEEVRAAVQEHHSPSLPLARVLSAADEFVHSPAPNTIEALGLSQEDATQLIEDFQAEYAAIGQFYR